MDITPEMIEAGAKAIAPEVWATDPSIFGHPDSLNRRGHELCKNMVRAQSEGCLRAALALELAFTPNRRIEMTRTSAEIREELDSIPGRVRALKDELQRASLRERAPVAQDRAYWLSIYPDGNFPLGALD